MSAGAALQAGFAPLGDARPNAAPKGVSRHPSRRIGRARPAARRRVSPPRAFVAWYRQESRKGRDDL